MAERASADRRTSPSAWADGPSVASAAIGRFITNTRHKASRFTRTRRQRLKRQGEKNTDVVETPLTGRRRSRELFSERPDAVSDVLVVCHFYDLSETQNYEAAISESETSSVSCSMPALGHARGRGTEHPFPGVNAAMLLCHIPGYNCEEALLAQRAAVPHPGRPSDVEPESGSTPGAGRRVRCFDVENAYGRKTESPVGRGVTVKVIRDCVRPAACATQP